MTVNEGIFISYRHDDALSACGALYRELVDRYYDARLVFWDAEIKPGADWLRTIEQKIDSCKVLLAIISPRWLGAALNPPAGEPDILRRELKRARAKGVRVIAVRVAGAAMPRREELPSDLRWLADEQWANLTEEHYHADVERLVEAIGGAAGTVVVSSEPEPTLGERPMVVLRSDGPYSVFIDGKLMAEFDALKGERQVELRVPFGQHTVQAAVRPRTQEITLARSRGGRATSPPPHGPLDVRVQPTTHPQVVYAPEMTLYEPSESIPFELKGGQHVRFQVSSVQALQPHRVRCVLRPPRAIVRP